MQFIVNRITAIEADTPEEALEKTKSLEGQTISFNVNPRPQSAPAQAITTSNISGSTPSRVVAGGQFSRTITQPVNG